jgi:hypothetical protein
MKPQSEIRLLAFLKGGNAVPSDAISPTVQLNAQCYFPFAER